MTVEVERDALLSAVQRVVSVVESRNTIPVLANLLVQARDGLVTITGTDLDLQVSASVEAVGDLDTTVDAQKLLAAVNSFAPGKLVIAPVEGRAAITVKRGRGVRTLSTLSSTDFPLRSELEDAVSFNIASASLLRLLDTASVAQANDPTRYYLNGVFLHVRDDQLLAVGCDGHRFVRCQTTAPDGAKGMIDTIVPSKAVGHIRKLLAKMDSEVRLSITDRAFDLSFGRTRVTGNGVDGIYADYSRVIPPEGEHRITGARGAVLEPVASVAAVVNAEGERKLRVVTFELRADGEHEVSAKDAAGTSSVEPLDCGFDGPPIRFGVDSKYLSAIAGVFAESGNLTIAIGEPTAAMRITGDKDTDLLAVIGPYAI